VARLIDCTDPATLDTIEGLKRYDRLLAMGARAQFAATAANRTPSHKPWERA